MIAYMFSFAGGRLLSGRSRLFSAAAIFTRGSPGFVAANAGRRCSSRPRASNGASVLRATRSGRCWRRSTLRRMFARPSPIGQVGPVRRTGPCSGVDVDYSPRVRATRRGVGEVRAGSGPIGPIGPTSGCGRIRETPRRKRAGFTNRTRIGRASPSHPKSKSRAR